MKQTFFLKKKIEYIIMASFIEQNEFINDMGLAPLQNGLHTKVVAVILHWKDTEEWLDLYRLSAKIFMGERTQSNLRAAEVTFSVIPTWSLVI